MGRLLVSGLENAARAAIVSRFSHEPAADRSRGHEPGRQPAGFLRQRERVLRIALHRRFGHCGLDHRAPAVCGRLVDEAGGGVDIDRRERARPVAAPGAVVEHRLTRPGGGRRALARIAYPSAAP